MWTWINTAEHWILLWILNSCIIHSVSECTRSCVSHTYSTECDKRVLPGADVLVIGPVSPHMSCTVDQPGSVKHHRVPQQTWDEVRNPQRLPPQQPRHDCGDKEAHEQHRRLVIPIEMTEGAETQNEFIVVYTMQHKHTNVPLVRREIVRSHFPDTVFIKTHPSLLRWVTSCGHTL